MKLSVLSILLISCCFLHAQIESPFNKGAKFLSMGNAGAALEGNSSLFYNQAGIAGSEFTSFSFQGARLYDDSGLYHLHAGMVFPASKLGVFGLRVMNFGIDGYNFQNYALTYSRKLFTNFSLAATFNMYQFRIENYGNAFSPNLELGIRTDLSEKIALGVHVANPFPIAVTDRTVIPTIFSAGIQYKISSLVSINADVEKNIRETQNFKIGVNYQLHQILQLRVGLNTFPGTFYFGLGLKWNQLEIDLGNGYHQVLGNTTGLGVTYRIGGK